MDAYKSQLIATVSHELKNPLTSVVGHLGLLEDIDVVRRAGSRHLAAARRGTDRMTQVIDSLLLLSQLDRAERVSASERIDLTRLACAAVELTAVMAEQRGQRIRTELSDRPVHVRFREARRDGFAFGVSADQPWPLTDVAKEQPQVRRAVVEPATDVLGRSQLGTKRGRGRGGAIDSVLEAVDGFYGEVLQHLKARTAAPPRMREVAELPDERRPVLVSTALSSQDGVEPVDEASSDDVVESAEEELQETSGA